MRVLIVEDGRVDAMLLQRELRQMAETRVAETAALGRELAVEWEPDCVILDHGLPDADGIELIPFFSALSVPVVMITASDDAALDRAVMKAGAEDYLQKGTGDSETLRRTVRHAIERHGDRQLFQSVVDSSPVGMMIVTGKKVVSFASGRMLQMLGQTEADVVGQPVSELFAAVESGDVDICGLIDDGEGGAWGELSLLTAGEKLSVEVHVRRVVKRGAPHVLVNVSDISRRQKLELHLRQAQKMEAVGRLAGGIAHDFNNLLTTIMSFGELVQETLVADSMPAADMRELLRSADRAASLTRQLLAFSRQQAIQPRKKDLNQLLSEVEKLLSRLLADDMELKLELGGERWDILIDPHAFEQVVVNLAVNAKDAMSSGGVLTLRTHSEVVARPLLREGHQAVEPGEYVVLEVKDTGVGIPLADRGAIFEPFFSTKEEGAGTGLGLSTCLGIVEQAGGHIWLDSEPGEGARFLLYFPRSAPDAPVSLAPREIGPMSGDERVLVVEDDEQVRALVSRVLSAQGYEVLTASSVEGAVELLGQAELPVDLLLTDVVLKGGNGRELAEKFQLESPGTRTLLMSGYTKSVLGTHGVVADEVPLLLKPFSPRQVARRVREALDDRTLTRA